uniref:Lysyl oxidase homolog n=1 Tax=Pygocentrus nattereri TaxID=42514 RepID=A0AAR2L431_PYGNA
ILLTSSPQHDQLKFRLAGYPRKHNEGRVEVFYNGEWGSICDDDFTLSNAHVLCRHLGFVEALSWSHSAKYGAGTGKIWLDNVMCSGSEKSIEKCLSRGWGNSDCTHEEDAGVVCKDERLPGFLDSNIIESHFFLSARLFFPFLHRTEPTGCRLAWGWGGGGVLCAGASNNAGYRLCSKLTSYDLPAERAGGRGKGRERENERGKEREAEREKRKKRKNTIEGVRMKKERNKKERGRTNVDENRMEEIRLRPLSAAHAARMPVTEGVVEVKYKEGWSQICNIGWTIKNSRVICGMMGFPSEKITLKKPHSDHSMYKIHSVACTGNEAHLSTCTMEFSKNTSAPCIGGGPVVVSCVPGPQFAQGRGRKNKPNHVTKVRLKGGARAGEGRVEVLIGSEWGTVCDDLWNLLSASVVCRELGFGTAKEALTGARMGQGMGPIYMNEVQCLGDEKSLRKCPHKSITAKDCKHMEDVSVKCNIPYMGFEKAMRIVGGRTDYEGRVEVQVGSQWGTLCSDGWSTREAMVACGQLGLGYALHAITETWYWDSSNVTEMVMSGVKCRGDEMTLSDCQHHRVVSCKRAGPQFAAGIICSESASDMVLNAPLVERSVYIEDRPLHLLYCAAEENCLSKSAVGANWPYGHRRLLRFSSEIHNVGRADFRPRLGRHSWVWHECHRHYHSMDIFTNYDLLDLNGTKVADGHKASFCLEDTECHEGILKQYECANFGEQGITVGCWDTYRHDIDCQWIDITDVKPGNYILQVIINPNFEVAESDFTNNAMRCNCKYDGNRVWLHKCHLGDSYSEEAEKQFELYPGQLNNQIS